MKSQAMKVIHDQKPSSLSGLDTNKKPFADKLNNAENMKKKLYKDFAREWFDKNKSILLISYPVHGLYSKAP